MNRPHWSELALADLNAIGAYIEQFDAAASERVVATIDRAASRLVDFPLSGVRLPGRRVRKLSIPKVHYIICYDPGVVLAILRVVHMRRRQR